MKPYPHFQDKVKMSDSEVSIVKLELEIMFSLLSSLTIEKYQPVRCL